MAKITTSRATVVDENAISPEEYAGFISQIELQTIWLNKALVQNYCGPDAPDRNSVRINSKTKWESMPSGFRAFVEYKVRLKSNDEPSLNLDVTYGLDFASSEPMTDEIFMIFRDVNLPVNTWPYLREFVFTMIGRMNWAPFTLPTFKTGIGRSAGKASSHTDVQSPISK